MPPATRRTYRADFKLEAIQYAEENGNRAAGREFIINESMIRKWRRQKDALRTTKKSRKAFRGDKPRWPELESQVEEWVLEQRAAGRGISTLGIRLKAKIVAEQMGEASFQGGPSWCLRFMRRKRLVIRAHKTVVPRLPQDWEEKLATFRSYTTEVVAEKKVDLDRVVNMDEVPLTFDIPMSRTMETVGAETAPVCTTGHEMTSFTVVLACTASGRKLPPMVIFKRKTLPREKFPAGIVVRCNAKGWMDEATMIDWIDSCFVKRPGGFSHTSTSLLVVDSIRAHLTDSVKDHLRKTNSSLTIVPGGLTKLLQPLDISVNKPFKEYLRGIWERWMVDGDHSFTKTGRQRRASYADVCKWVLESWTRISVATIMNGFRKSEMLSSVPDTDADDDLENMRDDDACTLSPELAQLFHSDSEDEDFEGFPVEESDL